MNNNIQLEDLTRTQLITFINNYNSYLLESVPGHYFDVPGFLQCEVHDEKEYLKQPVRFVNDQLKLRIVPQYIVLDGMLDIVEDTLISNNINIPDNLNDRNNVKEVPGIFEQMAIRFNDLLTIQRNSERNQIDINNNKQVKEMMEQVKKYAATLTYEFDDLINK